MSPMHVQVNEALGDVPSKDMEYSMRQVRPEVMNAVISS